MDSLNTQILFRNKYNIDDNELTLLEILLIAQEEEDNELVKLYFTSTKNIRTNLIALKDAGIILKSYKIPEKGEHLDTPNNRFDKVMTHDYLYINTTGLKTDNPDAPKGRVPWTPSQTDLLAHDWYVPLN